MMASVDAFELASARTESADTAAVRASVIAVPSRIAATLPVCGSSIISVASCVGSPAAELCGQMLTILVPAEGGSLKVAGIVKKQDCGEGRSATVRRGWMAWPEEKEIRAFR